MNPQREYTPKQWRHTQYASYLGYITQAIVNNLAPLLFLIFQEVYPVSYTHLIPFTLTRS